MKYNVESNNILENYCSNIENLFLFVSLQNRIKQIKKIRNKSFYAVSKNCGLHNDFYYYPITIYTDIYEYKRKRGIKLINYRKFDESNNYIFRVLRRANKNTKRVLKDYTK